MLALAAFALERARLDSHTIADYNVAGSAKPVDKTLGARLKRALLALKRVGTLAILATPVALAAPVAYVTGDILPSLSDMVAAKDAGLDAEMQGKLSTTMMALGRIKTAAEAGFAYDQMLERGNVAGEKLVMGGVNGLVNQTRSIERVVTTLGLNQIAFEGSDSLDDPNAVFQ